MQASKTLAVPNIRAVLTVRGAGMMCQRKSLAENSGMVIAVSANRR
jgi:hypothetical protein